MIFQHLIFLVLGFTFTTCLHFVPKNQQVKEFQVLTSNGLVQGKQEQTKNGMKYYKFSGIPYAKPPIEELRFRAPLPMKKWNGVLDATQERECCAGLSITGITNFVSETLGSEDCLFLNIFTPKKPTDESLYSLPVYFFTYGGAFSSGCPQIDYYGPENFVEYGVILVTYNYRIGVYGFLSTGDKECPGNWGIKDQLAALKWVNKNIRNFGGDPNRVTIGGQSAGAASTSLLLLSPRTRNLFSGVILHSGSILCPWSYQKESREIAFQIGLSMGIETNSSRELVAALRKLPSEKITKGQVPVIVFHNLRFVIDGFPFTPVLEPESEDAVFTDYAYNMLKQGRFPHVPILAGVTNLEFLFFQLGIDRFKAIATTLLDASPGLLTRNIVSMTDRHAIGKKIINHFSSSKNFYEASDREIYEYFSDELFVKPLQETVKLLAKYNPSYFFLFSYEGKVAQVGLKNVIGLKEKKLSGAAHTEELFYLFNGFYSKNMTATDKKVSRKMLTLWSNFIKYGNPTPKEDPILDGMEWPAVSEDKFPYLLIDNELNVIHENFNEKHFKFWENIYERFAKEPFIIFRRK